MKEKKYSSFQELKDNWQAFEALNVEDQRKYLEQIQKRYGRPQKKGFTRPVDNEAQEIERIDRREQMRNDNYFNLKEISL